MADENSPSLRSADHQAMAAYWEMVDAILGGAPALRMKAATYLPKFPNEGDKDYEFRRQNAPLTNIYADISRNLASKPFSKPVELSDDAPERLAGALNERTKRRTGGLVDDIDGQGNSLHVFAAEAFKAGLDKGITWILVDHTAAPPRPASRPLSRAEEQALGLRPYWVHVPAERLIAVHSEFLGGVVILVHARIEEPTPVREGYKEILKKRIPVIDRAVTQRTPDGRPLGFGPAAWELLEERENETRTDTVWVSIGRGSYSIGVIPLVPFITGRRHGTSYRVDPPLRDLAWMQIEEFQQESNLKEAKNLTAFPMLVREGIVPDDGKGGTIKVPVGPRSVLFAPPGNDGQAGSWKFIEPSSTSLTFLKEDLAAFRQEMRDLGMQPLLAANLTVITSANVSQKASSAVQAWAILFKDSLDRCLALTSKWLGIPDTTTAKVHTDFVVDVNANGDLDGLLKARVAGEISQRTYCRVVASGDLA